MIETGHSEPSDILSDGELSVGDLLAADGTLFESGYAFKHVKRYSRGGVKKLRSRIKERDCYYFGDDRHAVAMSVARYAHTAVATVTVLDFVHISKAVKRKVVSSGGVEMPSAVDSGKVAFDSHGLKMSFDVDCGKRTLKCECKELDGKRDFECEIVLDESRGDNITTVMPLEKSGEFFYGTKINGFKGVGRYTLGDERIEFSREACGELEWSRGVYSQSCGWYRVGLSTEIDGAAMGISLLRFAASKCADGNAIFYDGKASKLDGVKFEIPFTLGALDYLKPWRISDDKGRVELMFYPMIEAEEKMGWGLSAVKHKVYGKFYGKATLEDGTIIDIADKIGYAEHTVSRW